MLIDRSQYAHVVVLTGAGISAGSGLRTYRGPDGIWDENEIERFSSASALRDRPEDTWSLFGALRAPVLAARPNAAHLALAQWEATLAPDQELLVVTQNIDGLHQRAGSRNVVELHGSLLHTVCSNAHCDLPRFRDESTHAGDVPLCPRCGAVLRPDIVLFGEEIPALAHWTVKRALRACDLFLAVGTSGLVMPAARYVRDALCAGARTVLVNLEPMGWPEAAFREQYLGRAEMLLPRLLDLDSPC